MCAIGGVLYVTLFGATLIAITVCDRLLKG